MYNKQFFKVSDENKKKSHSKSKHQEKHSKSKDKKHSQSNKEIDHHAKEVQIYKNEYKSIEISVKDGRNEELTINNKGQNIKINASNSNFQLKLQSNSLSKLNLLKLIKISTLEIFQFQKMHFH